MRVTSWIIGLSLVALVSGCATVAPPQLVEARDAYGQSSHGLAAKMTPTELYDAKKVLDRAEKEFTANGDTLAVRDYSYIALRKVQLADVKARTALDSQRISDAATQGVAVRDDQAKSDKAELKDTKEALKDERAANTLTHAEQQARTAADLKLAAMMADLAVIASVKQEARGTVITLSGGVLFASGQSTLLSSAKAKLNQVGEALKAEDLEKQFVIEGHTDSFGSPSSNQPLSLSRANAVRDYLILRGVSPGKMSAVGYGATRPLVDNSNAENRANNRRVEIIVQAAPVTVR
jgi:outer membrane protein OmpA-like peptidoglycan-associated protein